jgi:hypothetical protein
LNSLEDRREHFVIVADKSDELLSSLHEKGPFAFTHGMRGTDSASNQLVSRGFLDTHKKAEEPKVRREATHFQRLTDIHKAV